VGEPIVDQDDIRRRVLAVLEKILGFKPDPDTEQLSNLDSLQVLEFLVSLEEEFDVDSDAIIESHEAWWTSLDGLVATIATLTRTTRSEATAQG
jgi:acyl carrier protein